MREALPGASKFLYRAVVMALQSPEELGEQVEEPEDLDDQDASSISPAEEITLLPGPGGDDEVDEPLLLPWDRFSAWLHCICVVGFDLELGQAVEVRERSDGYDLAMSNSFTL